MQKEIKIRVKHQTYKIVLPIQGSSYYKRHKKVFQYLFKKILREDLFGGYKHIKIIYSKNREFELFHSINATIEKAKSKLILDKLSSLEKSLDEIMLSKDDVPLVYLDKFYFDEVKEKIKQQEKKQQERIQKRREAKKSKFTIPTKPFSLPQTSDSKDSKKKDTVTTPPIIIAKPQILSEKQVISFSWNNERYIFVKTNHLYQKRNGKPRIAKFTDEALQGLILEALKYPQIQIYETFALVFPKDKEKSNYYSLLLNFDKQKHTFVIITIFAEDDKYRKRFLFPKVKDKLILEDISLEILSSPCIPQNRG